MKKIFFLTLLIFTTNIFAQSTGKLIGKITDKNTGEALPGVNVILQGTYYGAATDINSNFKINKINQGTYTIKFL